MRRLRVNSVLALAILVSASACYSHAAIPGTRPAPGTPVMVDLTDKGTYDLTPRVGASVTTLEGHIVAADDTSLTIAMTSATDNRGIPTTWSGERIVVGRDYIASVRERRLSRTRSWLLAGGLVALAVLAGGIGLSGGGSGPGDGGNSQ